MKNPWTQDKRTMLEDVQLFREAILNKKKEIKPPCLYMSPADYTKYMGDLR